MIQTDMGRPAEAGYSQAMQRAVVIAVVIGDFLSPYLASSLSIAIPVIGTEMGLDAVSLGWIVTSFLLGSSAITLAAGRLGDIYGYKRIFALGMIVSTIGCIIAGFATTYPVLIFSLVLIGVSNGFIWGTTIPLLTSAFPPTMRGKLMGYNSAAVYSGVAAGPILGGVLIQFFGWHSIFLTIIPVGILDLFLVCAFVWKLPDTIDTSGSGFDIGGTVLFAVAMAVLIYGFSTIPHLTGFLCIAGALILFTGFMLYEKRATSPIFDVGLLFGNRKFMLAGVAAMLGFSVTAGVVYVMNIFIQSTRGFNPFMAGLVFVGGAICQIIFSMVAGNLSDRRTAGHVSAAGLVITAVALVFLTTTGMETSLLMIAGFLMFLYTGVAIFGPPNTYAIMGVVPPEKYGMAAGTIATFRRFGNQLSVAIPMMVFSVMLGNVVLADVPATDFLGAMQVIFWMFFALTLTGIVCSVMQERR